MLLLSFFLFLSFSACLFIVLKIKFSNIDKSDKNDIKISPLTINHCDAIKS